MDVSKKTTLEDSASIYNRREEKSEKQKWRELRGREKWTYFKDYYLKKLLGCIVGVCLLAYLLYTMLSPKPETVTSAAIVNLQQFGTLFDELETNFTGYLGLDGETQITSFDYGYLIGGSDYTSAEKLSTFIYANVLDIIIAPAEVFQSYMTGGVLLPLSEQLPADLYLSLSDHFLSGEIVDSLTGEVEENSYDVYGVYIDGLESFAADYWTEETRPLIGIVANTKYKDNAMELIRYLFEHY